MEQTKIRRPRIKSLPVYTSTVEARIKKIKKELGIGPNMNFDDRWAQIRREVSLIT